MVGIAVSHIVGNAFDAWSSCQKESGGVVEFFEKQILEGALVAEFLEKVADIGWREVHLTRDVIQVVDCCEVGVDRFFAGLEIQGHLIDSGAGRR